MSALDIKAHIEAIRERQPSQRRRLDAVPTPDYRVSVINWARLEGKPDILLYGKLAVGLDDWGVSLYNLSLAVRANGRPAISFPKRPILTDGVRGMGHIATFYSPEIRRAFSEACLAALLAAEPELNALLSPQGNTQ
jgi:hypothetical protein